MSTTFSPQVTQNEHNVGRLDFTEKKNPAPHYHAVRHTANVANVFIRLDKTSRV